MTKFCIHISGSDDIIPVNDVAEAVRASAYMNAEYLAVIQSLPEDGLTPTCFAVPMIWPGEESAHEAELQHRKRRAREKGCPHWMI